MTTPKRLAETSKGKRSWVQESVRKGDIRFDTADVIIIIVLALLFAYPMYLVFISAFSSPREVFSGRVFLLPRGSNEDGLKMVLNTSSLWSGYRNTILYTLLGTSINLFVTITGAFVLSRKNFLFKGVISFLVVFTMFFSGGMIPSFLLIRSLKLLNTVWALVLPGACSTWNLMVAKTFLQTSIPDELSEAARIDGCGHTRFLVSIVLPCSSTLIAVMVLFYGVSHWNSYWNAMMYMTKTETYPLQLVLRNILLQAEVAVQQAQSGDTDAASSLAELYYRSESMKYIVVVAAVLPMLVVFPFIQKYFIKGVMIGSVKG